MLWNEDVVMGWALEQIIDVSCILSQKSTVLHYWRGTAKRLIKINWIDIWGVQTIHRFGHQPGPGKRSGGPSTAKIHVFSEHVFGDRSA